MSQIVLVGPRGLQVAEQDSWEELLGLAVRFGWQPAFPHSHYFVDINLEVDAIDSYGIACALSNAAEVLIRKKTIDSVPNLPELIGDICELIAFCCDGDFKVSYSYNENVKEAGEWLEN